MGSEWASLGAVLMQSRECNVERSGEEGGDCKGSGACEGGGALECEGGEGVRGGANCVGIFDGG